MGGKDRLYGVRARAGDGARDRGGFDRLERHGGGSNSPFLLGKTNTVNAITKLAGSVPGASLVVDNNSTGTDATALDLQVEAGKAPMKVNSNTKVDQLNADMVDGLSSEQLQGDPGPKGDQGVQGDPGLKGDQGIQGIQGQPGPVNLQVREAELTTPPSRQDTAKVFCLPGEKATGGGAQTYLGDTSKTFYFEPGGIPLVSGGQPVGWRSHYFNGGSEQITVKVFVICAS